MPARTPLGAASAAVSPLEARTRLTVDRLAASCRAASWAGHDPYDALNSRLFERSPLSRSRTLRLALTQTLKRLPIQTRWLLRVPAAQNAKALALFLDASAALGRRGAADYLRDARLLADRLLAMRSPGQAAWCWGYHFPWQTRHRLVPRDFPNLVCTTFVADSLVTAFELFGDRRYLEAAISAGTWIVDDLYWSDGADCGFCYPLPGERNSVHNANFLAAALLCRVDAHAGDARLRQAALSAARHSARHQRQDGSWFYGEGANQRWIDHFHTGFNLSALTRLVQLTGEPAFHTALIRGVPDYTSQLFAGDLPKYYSHRTAPLDIHCVAQALMTLTHVADLDVGARATRDRLLAWALDNMQSRAGTFFYQRWPWFTNRLSYMRWSQAWMLLALSTWLEDTRLPIERLASHPLEEAFV